MSIVDQAIENLEDHDVEVEKPRKVESHSQVNSRSEVSSMFGMREGLEAASYNSLNDRMDVYKPLSAKRVIEELDEDNIEQVDEAFERNKSSFEAELGLIGLGEGESFADKVKVAKFMYDSAIQDEEVDDNLQDQLKKSFRREILHDIEHESVHASHYQQVLDEDVDPLEEGFQRYIRDVERVNEEPTQNEQRRMNEGISDLKDIEVAAAMNFVEDDRLQNIIALAGEEKKKWERREHNNHQEYREAKQEAVSGVKESLDYIPQSKFDSIQMRVEKEFSSGIGPGGPNPDYNSAGEMVEELAENGNEKYQDVVEAGVSKEELKGALTEVEQIQREWENRDMTPLNNKVQAQDHLEDAILREAEIQGDFEGYMEQYANRVEQVASVPKEFTEAFAQFWTAYRKGNLEGNREEVSQRVEAYDHDGIDEVMDDIFQMYDDAEGDQHERVTEVMSSQLDYLEQNYDVDT